MRPPDHPRAIFQLLIVENLLKVNSIYAQLLSQIVCPIAPQFGWRNSDTHFHWPAGAADGSDTYDCHQNISPNETSLSNPGQLTFPKPFARPLVNLVVGHQIIDGRNKIAIPTRPPLISPMTCRLKGWRLFVNLLQIGVIRIMQRPSEKASLAWTNVWIDTHKTKEGEGREKVNVGVLNPLIAARGGYTTQYSKTNRRFLCRLYTFCQWQHV